MNKNELVKELIFESEATRKSAIDYKRVLFRALRYWYVIVVCVAMTLTLAFLYNRYAAKIFPVNASLIVKEADDISGAEILYNNPLLNFKRNYLNEIYILKSYPLVQQVVEDLNFDVVFYREGNILTTEAYDYFPVEILPIRDRIPTQTIFEFQFLDERQFKIKKAQDPDSEEWKVFPFDDTVRIEEFSGVFKLKAAGASQLTSGTFIFAYTPAQDVATHYIESLNVEWAEEGAGVVNLSINGSNPKKAKDFMTGLIAQYQKNDLEIKNEAATRTVDFISEQLQGISDSLRMVERELEMFKDKNIVTDLKGEALRLYEKIEVLEGERSQLTISRNYYNYLIDYIERNQELHQIILPSSVGISDPILSSLVSEMNALQLDIKMLGKSQNPLITDGVRRVNAMKKDIIESVRNQLSTDKIKFDFLSKQINDIEQDLSRLPFAERTLVSIQRNYALQENLYIFLLQKRSEAAISKASNASDIIVVNPPRANNAIAPKTIRNYIVAALLGVIIPFMAFLLIEVFDNRIQTKEDIERIATIPVIGCIGHNTTQSNLIVFNQPKSALSESFRALRYNLNYFLGGNERGTFLVTSSISGEGKSFTTINLASVMSMSGKKTLIIGADMRRPKIFDDFELPNDVGLSTYLAGLSDFNSVVQKTKFENLDVISGGPIPPNPNELLLNVRMADLIIDAKVIYDFIIIDTSPMAIVTDAYALTSYADHILYLVRQNYTPRELLVPVEDLFSSGKLKNISILLNDIYKSGPGYGYAYNYGYGYGYGAYETSRGQGYYQ